MLLIPEPSLQSYFFLILCIYFTLKKIYVYVIFACMYTCVPVDSWWLRSEAGIRNGNYPELGVMNGCKPPHGYWESLSYLSSPEPLNKIPINKIPGLTVCACNHSY